MHLHENGLKNGLKPLKNGLKKNGLELLVLAASTPVA
jgi:hypothetical protein